MTIELQFRAGVPASCETSGPLEQALARYRRGERRSPIFRDLVVILAVRLQKKVAPGLEARGDGGMGDCTGSAPTAPLRAAGRA